MEKTLIIKNTKYKIINSTNNEFFYYAVIEKDDKKYFIKKLKKMTKEYKDSINCEISFLKNNNIKYIPKIYDYELDNFIVYDYIDGKNLKQVNLDAKKSIQTIIKLCNILKEVHDLGFSHNDIKQSNIMIDNDDVYLIDFGNCSFFKEKVNFYSKRTAAVEILNRENVDNVSDIYSIGVVLKELNKDNNKEINDIVKKCIYTDKTKRYQSVIELKNELLKINL